MKIMALFLVFVLGSPSLIYGQMSIEFLSGMLQAQQKSRKARQEKAYREQLLELERRKLRLQELTIENQRLERENQRRIFEAEQRSREKLRNQLTEVGQRGSCIEGPEFLREIDNLSQQGLIPKITDNQSGQRLNSEEAAESLITYCSKDLSRLSAAAALIPESKAATAVVTLFRENLGYMKWWLQNRRQKKVALPARAFSQQPRAIPVVKDKVETRDRLLY